MGVGVEREREQEWNERVRGGRVEGGGLSEGGGSS